MSFQRYIVEGRLPRDPEPIGTSGVKFTVGVSEYNYSTKQREMEWVSCKAFGKTAEFIARNFHAKGDILVEGRIRTREYEVQGQKRKETSVIVDAAYFSGSGGGASQSDGGTFQATTSGNEFGW